MGFSSAFQQGLPGGAQIGAQGFREAEAARERRRVRAAQFAQQQFEANPQAFLSFSPELQSQFVEPIAEATGTPGQQIVQQFTQQAQNPQVSPAVAIQGVNIATSIGDGDLADAFLGFIRPGLTVGDLKAEGVDVLAAIKAAAQFPGVDPTSFPEFAAALERTGKLGKEALEALKFNEDPKTGGIPDATNVLATRALRKLDGARASGMSEEEIAFVIDQGSLLTPGEYGAFMKKSVPDFAAPVSESVQFRASINASPWMATYIAGKLPGGMTNPENLNVAQSIVYEATNQMIQEGGIGVSSDRLWTETFIGNARALAASSSSRDMEREASAWNKALRLQHPEWTSEQVRAETKKRLESMTERIRVAEEQAAKRAAAKRAAAEKKK